MPSTMYDVSANIRFSSGAGSIAYSVLEYDASSVLLASHLKTYYGNNWEFDKQTISFTSNPSTMYFKIRFSAGGTSSGVYCDVDWVLDCPQ